MPADWYISPSIRFDSILDQHYGCKILNLLAKAKVIQHQKAILMDKMDKIATTWCKGSTLSIKNPCVPLKSGDRHDTGLEGCMAKEIFYIAAIKGLPYESNLHPSRAGCKGRLLGA